MIENKEAEIVHVVELSRFEVWGPDNWIKVASTLEEAIEYCVLKGFKYRITEE